MAPSLRQRGWSVFVLSFARKGPECDGYKMNRKNSTLAALAAGARRFLMVILAKELFYSNFVAGNAPFLAHMRQIGRTGGLLGEIGPDQRAAKPKVNPRLQRQMRRNRF